MEGGLEEPVLIIFRNEEGKKHIYLSPPQTKKKLNIRPVPVCATALWWRKWKISIPPCFPVISKVLSNAFKASPLQLYLMSALFTPKPQPPQTLQLQQMAVSLQGRAKKSPKDKGVLIHAIKAAQKSLPQDVSDLLNQYILLSLLGREILAGLYLCNSDKVNWIQICRSYFEYF